MRKVYMDNAATTYVSNEVLTEMLPIFNTTYGNSSSLHGFGRDAVAELDKARDRVAKAINANPNEIYFTSGGTEANNWAIYGIAMANRNKGNHIITSSIEHHSILDMCKYLETQGFRVTYLPVDEYGLVSITDLIHNLTDDTILVSVMGANNEIGTVQNIHTIAKIAHEKNVPFHTDCVQAIGALSIDVKAMEIDALSLSAHKIHGPKGMGALYVKKGIRFESLIRGGNQERGKRGGTVNVVSAVGLGKAIEIATRDMSVNVKKLRAMREYFLTELGKRITDFKVNGHPQQRLPGLASVSFDFIEGESIMMLLDLEGIAVSTGSACSSGSLERSHVLTAIGLDPGLANGTIRFSFDKSTTKEEINYMLDVLEKSVAKLRAISPLNRKKRS